MIPRTVYTDNSYLRYRSLTQDSTEFWQRRTERARFISASEVPTVCYQGWSPKKDLEELLQSKRTGVRTEVNDFVKAAQAHGKHFERYARRYFEETHELKVYETGLWVHPVEQRIAASPDGLFMSSAGHIPVEFKCPYKATTPISAARVHKDSLQMQTAIQCCGAPYGVLMYYWHDHDQPDAIAECFLIENNPSHWLQIVAHVDWFLSLVNDPSAALIVDYSLNRRRYAELVQQYFVAAEQTDSGAGLLQERLSHSSGKRRHPGEESAASRAAASPPSKRVELDIDFDRDELFEDIDLDADTQAP